MDESPNADEPVIQILCCHEEAWANADLDAIVDQDDADEVSHGTAQPTVRESRETSTGPSDLFRPNEDGTT